MAGREDVFILPEGVKSDPPGIFALPAGEETPPSVDVPDPVPSSRPDTITPQGLDPRAVRAVPNSIRKTDLGVE